MRWLLSFAYHKRPWTILYFVTIRFTRHEFIGFSRIVKRHPGIVAGQLQHKTGRNDLFNKFKPRVRELITATALTDGYGKSAPTDI